MARVSPIAWDYQAMPDPQARLGVHTTLVVRAEGADYTVLGVFPGPELAGRFLEALLASPHERLFDGPMTLGPGYVWPGRPSPPGRSWKAEFACPAPSTPTPPSGT